MWQIKLLQSKVITKNIPLVNKLSGESHFLIYLILCSIIMPWIKNMSIIDVKDLSFAYTEEKMTIDHISFSVEEGSYTTLIGHNGSGKSTVAKLLLGLLNKKTGSIFIDGKELNDENLYTIRSSMGIVFQNPDNQFIGSTVRDDIAFGLENHCVPQPEMDPIINANAETVRMMDHLESEPTFLSGGQKQRVAIAGILAMKPKIIIFDEATSMLDPQGKDDIKKVVNKLHKENNLTILSITHDINEVASSDHVIAMSEGKVALEGRPEDVFRNVEELQKIQLDIPYSMKVEELLRKKGIKISNQITTEGLVNELWQLHSKM